ncbi:MAG: hypothetical protein M1814_006714 [Vezdaea aestivalis]|nr:MAG: hypothetical protein M1814_006714 [Vezdaea aestivalis]
MSPPGTRQPPSKNLQNQRAFRARRVAYVQSLEQQIKALKTSQLQATLEVQAAARRVADENRQLRLLIEREFGTGKEEVERLLLNQTKLRNGGQGGQIQEANVVTKEHGLRGEGIRYTRPLLAIDDDPNTAATLHLPSSRIPVAACTFGSKEKNDTSSPLLDRLGATHQSPAPEPLRESDTVPVKPTGAGDKSCEEAARIIASLRGTNASEDILRELGCSSDRSCAIKPLSIFELVDSNS